MSDFSDFTDFQIVLTNRTINDYLPRPQSSFSDFTDFQLALGSSLLVRNWSVKQYPEIKNNILVKETSSGVWESNCDFEVVDPSFSVETILGATVFTPQELIDMVSGSGGNVVTSFTEDSGVTVATIDLETNVDHLTVESDGSKYINPKLT